MFFNKYNRFYQIPITRDEKVKIYSNEQVKKFIMQIGFIEELEEYVIDAGSTKKFKKILKWVRKGSKKVEKLKGSIINKDNNKIAEGLLSGDINIDAMSQ